MGGVVNGMEIKCTKNLKYKIGDLVKVDKEKLRPNDLTLDEFNKAATGNAIMRTVKVAGVRPIVKIEYLVEFDDGVRLWVKDDLVK